MARQFNELVKDFNGIRSYARDFYINGYKQREDFQEKSLRSYDNERRRIESYLSEYIQWEQTPQGKSLRLEVTEQLTTNPFFRLWQTKSFTKNDIFLHFVLLDCLVTTSPQSLPQLIDLIHTNYLNQLKDPFYLTDITIRNKVKEYCQLGILEELESDKRILYQLKPMIDLPEALHDLLHFFKEVAPAGVIGQFLLNQQPPSTSPFTFKHHFIVHSLDEQIVLTALVGIQQQRLLHLEQFNGRESTIVPISLYVSTETGRQYLVGQLMRPNSLTSLRIDGIKEISLGSPVTDYQLYRSAYEEKKNRVWNSSFNQQRLKSLKVTLRIEEGPEDYLMTRLKREQRMGRSRRLDPQSVVFEIELTDLYAINPFLRTFIGRIIAIESTDRNWQEQFIDDLDQLISLYSTKEVNDEP